MTGHATNPPLLGYADCLSARPGETVAFKVSSYENTPVSAQLVRSISADPNPAGQGIVEEDASQFFKPLTFASTVQHFFPGSYAIASKQITASAKAKLVLVATVFPSMIGGQRQTILSIGQFDLHLDAMGAAAIQAGERVITTSIPLKKRNWHRIVVTVEASRITIEQSTLGRVKTNGRTVCQPCDNELAVSGFPVVAARLCDGLASQHFNGKIEAPAIIVDDQTVAKWDFSRDITSTTGVATVGPDLSLINFPARAMTGSRWDGSEMNWNHKPAHYTAIHFHEDDIYDFGWKTSFTFTIPADMPSGAYVMRLKCGAHEDAIAFFVCPPLGRPKAKLCVLISTFTYTIYGNHARPDYDPSWCARMDAWKAYPHNPAQYPHYGLSTYNYHSDGSGICHASHRRPLFNLRPGYLTFGATPCSGLRHFQADSHLISWLHAKGIDYDLITDRELHRDGVAAIEGYRVVTTATHPEYHTEETLNALRDYRDQSGNLSYLGGNGFYWRIAVHDENDSMLEIRRAEDGIRAWAAEPGEYYNAFDGKYGGLWRRNGRAPQELVGVGFAAQGEFYGAPYKRLCNDPDYDWVFAGIEENLIGDFGFSGNGAAGFELDRIDLHLGTPDNTIVLASSVTPHDAFMLVPEEQLTHLTNLSGGPEKDALRADMVYVDMPGGGSVFSTGSITFCGSLPWNDFDNSVSRLLENVLRKHLD